MRQERPLPHYDGDGTAVAQGGPGGAGGGDGESGIHSAHVPHGDKRAAGAELRRPVQLPGNRVPRDGEASALRPVSKNDPGSARHIALFIRFTWHLALFIRFARILRLFLRFLGEERWPSFRSSSLVTCQRAGSCSHPEAPFTRFSVSRQQEGWDAFHAWYDDEVWYPFGRPTNNTMYPGMQYLSAAVYGGLNQAGLSWSLPAVCCYISAWLAPISAVFTAGIAYEATGGSIAAFGAAGFIMALNKGHLLRSNGAGYDNEHVAIPAFCGAFYFWMCAIRPANRRWFVNAVLAGACHGCIAWTWGGYVIVPNIIGLSVLFTTLHGR